MKQAASQTHRAMASKHHLVAPIILFLATLACNLPSCVARHGVECEDLENVSLLERGESFDKALKQLGAELATAPRFKDSFHVQDSYIEFIKSLRKDVICGYCTPPQPGTVVHQCILPKPANPIQWFQLKLTTAAGAFISLAIRLDNLYLVGFQTPAGTWWEFGKGSDPHLIRGSRLLGFGEQYAELIGHNKLPTVTLGHDVMPGAVATLAAHTGQGTHEEPKVALARLVIMLCEGLRFLSVSNTVDRGFQPGGSVVKMTEVQAKQVNNWEKISKAVLLVWAGNPNAVVPELKPMGIENINDAARIVALVLDVRTGENEIEVL